MTCFTSDGIYLEACAKMDGSTILKPQPEVIAGQVAGAEGPVFESRAGMVLDVRWRKSNPTNVVLPLAKRWLAGLPQKILPVHLALRYPRIINLIAAEWNDEEMLRATFLELFTDRRGNRQGFPPEITRELMEVRDYSLVDCRSGAGANNAISAPNVAPVVRTAANDKISRAGAPTT
jgi:hypothetical protein